MPAFNIVTVGVETDKGIRWRVANAKTFLNRNGQMALLNKAGRIHISNAPINRTTKAPEAILEAAVTAVNTCTIEGCTPGHTGCEIVAGKDAVFSTTVVFSPRNDRPRPDRVVINYLPHRDTSGNTTGRWTLSERGSTSALSATALRGWEIVVPSGRGGRAFDPENDYWGGIASNGIAVMELVGTRAVRYTYLIRSAPIRAATFTPASRPVRITASSALAPLRVPKLNKEFRVNLRAGTHFSLNGAAARLQADRGLSPVVPAGQTLEIWAAATDKRPASARAASAILTRSN
jgi:hypothetical protein